MRKTTLAVFVSAVIGMTGEWEILWRQSSLGIN